MAKIAPRMTVFQFAIETDLLMSYVANNAARMEVGVVGGTERVIERGSKGPLLLTGPKPARTETTREVMLRSFFEAKDYTLPSGEINAKIKAAGFNSYGSILSKMKANKEVRKVVPGKWQMTAKGVEAAKAAAAAKVTAAKTE